MARYCGIPDCGNGPCDRERLWTDPARRKHDIPAPFRLLARARAQTRRRVSGRAEERCNCLRVGDGWKVGAFGGVSCRCDSWNFSSLDQHGPEDGAWCLAWASWTTEERHGPWMVEERHALLEKPYRNLFLGLGNLFHEIVVTTSACKPFGPHSSELKKGLGCGVCIRSE